MSEINVLDSDKLDLLMTKFDITPFTPTERDFLKEFVKVLTPITSGLRNLEQSNCHFGILLPKLLTIEKQLSFHLNSNDVKYCKPLVCAILKGVHDRFEIMKRKRRKILISSKTPY